MRRRTDFLLAGDLQANFNGSDSNEEAGYQTITLDLFLKGLAMSLLFCQ